MSKDTGIVNIHGKQYQTVALRVSTFREAFPEHSLITEVLHRDDKCVVMQARIVSPNGRVIATGHAEEYRAASSINKTSALENAETSAIGRALAGLGYGGTEFASADEVARAVSGAKISPVKSALQGVKVDADRAESIAKALIDFHAASESGDDVSYAVFELVEPLDSDMKLAVWDILSDKSKVRSWIKKIMDAQRKAA